MDREQHELYEYAKDRIKQKKRLYFHFVLLFLGSIFLFIANNWLSFYPEKNWWIWAVTIWIFLFVLHGIKVFITDSFMNKNWERAQIDKLMLKQTKKIEQLKKELTVHFKEASTYNKAKTMGDVVKRHLKQTLQKNLLLVPKSKP